MAADLTQQAPGWLGLAIFFVAYVLVILEERLGLRKSQPMLLAAAAIWALLAAHGHADAFVGVFGYFAELFFFLIVAMTYVGAIAERNVFEAMRAELVTRGFSYRQLFWITGILAFFLSAVLDNLTTALIMSGVILAVGAGNTRFVSLSFIGLVVAANAGGAWSAFGDITTLMVWQAHKAEFLTFFYLFVPSAVNYLVPALCLHFAVPRGCPPAGSDDAGIKPGGLGICALFAVTIAITVAAHHWLGLPPVFGMLAGLGLLQTYGQFIGRREVQLGYPCVEGYQPYSMFRIIAKAEWDTLLFFYGVLLSVGGLAAMGYLQLTSTWLYGGYGPTAANIAVGIASAVVDNIPIVYAVLQMNPDMNQQQWLLLTLTAGVGGSLLSLGSAAGVALMGASRGLYTFSSHLRWSWAVALGYVAAILMHLWINPG